MSSISELKEQINTKTSLLVFLSIASMGVYPIMWLYHNLRKFDSITKTKTVDDNYFTSMAICLGISYYMQTLVNQEFFIFMGFFLGFIVGVLYIVLAFKMKKNLENYCLNEYKIDLNMNGFYTFLFTILYINYIINEMPDIEKKQQILSSR